MTSNRDDSILYLLPNLKDGYNVKVERDFALF